MSSKANHINLENYEEYLLLYVDNELTTDEMEMVDAFLLVHPELQMELDILMSTKLPADEVSFGNVEDLMADQMKSAVSDDALLFYIDGELRGDEKRRLEDKIATNADYAGQLSILLKTKLDPADQVVYPNKQELYRHEKKVVPFRVWMQRAAAVIIIATVSVLYFNQPEVRDDLAATQVINKFTPEDTGAVTPPKATIAKQETTPTVDVVSNNPVKEVKPMTAATTVASIKTQVVVPQETFVTPTDAIAYQGRDVEVHPLQPTTEKAEINTGKFTESTVTNPVATPYINQEPAFASNVDSDVKTKGSLKGFLRKATRLIEKNTGISTGGDENELLIGALAVKL